MSAVDSSRPASGAAPLQPARTSAGWDGLRLFALSFAALFLELMVIRWVPAVVRFVAYYSNLMLISSFLGLGLGAMMARRKANLFAWFPVVLLVQIGSLVLCHRWVEMPTPTSELRFSYRLLPMQSYLVLIAIFAINTIVFIPLGQKIGQLFLRQRPLRAYGFDLGGSLCGTVCFGLMSLYGFSPTIGMAVVAGIVFAIGKGRQRIYSAPLLALVVLLVPLSVDLAAVWSPYHYITIYALYPPGPAVSEPVPDVQTTLNPPLYIVSVNTDFYQQHGTIDPRRYTPNDPTGRYVAAKIFSFYSTAYVLTPGRQQVCILGAGGGLDVEAALLFGARHVDAVEIDPKLVAIARRFSASNVYADPRVTLYVTDARAFLQSDRSQYDAIIFGLIDSHALFSYSNNVRLDGFMSRF
jgi:hypothetical protein